MNLGADSFAEPEGPGPAFYHEDELQARIAESPSLLPGVDDQPVAVAREVRVPPGIGRADVVVVDAAGEITIVECKLAMNPGSHGSVVGQVLSYAAGLAGLDYNEFKKRFEARGSSLTDPFSDDADWDGESFRSAVSTNLESGAFQLVIAVDELTKQLSHTIDFLAAGQLPTLELSALELSPRPDGRKPRQNRATLIAAVEGRSGAAAADAADTLLEWAENESRLRVSYDRHVGTVRTQRDTLFRVVRGRDLRVSVDKIRTQLEVSNARAAEKLVRDLERLGVPMDGKKARAPLASIDVEAVLDLMQRVLDDLEG